MSQKIYTSCEEHLTTSKFGRELLVDYERIPGRSETFIVESSLEFKGKNSKGVNNLIFKYIPNKEEAEKITLFNETSKKRDSSLPAIITDEKLEINTKKGKMYLVVEEKIEKDEVTEPLRTPLEINMYIDKHINILKTFSNEISEVVSKQGMQAYKYFDHKNKSRVLDALTDSFGKYIFNQNTINVLMEISNKYGFHNTTAVIHGNYHEKNRIETDKEQIIDIKGAGIGPESLDLAALISTIEHDDFKKKLDNNMLLSAPMLTTNVQKYFDIDPKDKTTTITQYVKFLETATWYNAVFAGIYRTEDRKRLPEFANRVNFFAKKLKECGYYNEFGQTNKKFSPEKTYNQMFKVEEQIPMRKAA